MKTGLRLAVLFAAVMICGHRGLLFAAEQVSDENGSAKTIPSSARSFNKSSWSGNSKTSLSTSAPVVAEISGTFNGQAYVKTETRTSTLALRNGRELTNTSVSYYNAQGQKVGVKSTGGWANREITFEYDAQGSLSKKTTVMTSHGWTNKPENGGKEFTRVVTMTSTYSYADVTDDAGKVTGRKVVETTVIERKVDGVVRGGAVLDQRVKETVTDTAGNTVSTKITAHYADGRAYEPKRLTYKEAIDLVFKKTKATQSQTR